MPHFDGAKKKKSVHPEDEAIFGCRAACLIVCGGTLGKLSQHGVHVCRTVHFRFAQYFHHHPPSAPSTPPTCMFSFAGILFHVWACRLDTRCSKREAIRCSTLGFASWPWPEVLVYFARWERFGFLEGGVVFVLGGWNGESEKHFTRSFVCLSGIFFLGLSI